MRSTSAQIVKEARQLAWPWTIVTLPGLAALVQQWVKIYPDLPRSAGPLRNPGEWLLPLGIFVGFSLLASLPLGAELQYRTLAMRFAQPIERHVLWRQKFLSTLAAVMPGAVIYCLAVGLRYSWPFSLMAATWTVVTVAGALPFTLLARTTMGGMVLNCAGGTAVIFSWTYYEKHHQFPISWLVILGIALAAYSVTMVWLGRRMILRFQAVEGMQADEGVVPGARFLPRALSAWFRPQPRQPLFNLLRREVHLLRMLWPLVAFYLAAWVFLVAFRDLPGQRPEQQLVAFVLTIILGILLAVLAGALSLGEEKTWGTHDWHMTLPVSVSTQWGVKLLFALTSSVTCTVLLPLLVIYVGSLITGTTTDLLKSDSIVQFLLQAALITLAAFWCACVVRGTVVATLWVFPLCFAIGSAAALYPELTLNVFSQPYRSLLSAMVTWFDPIALAQTAYRILTSLRGQSMLAIVVAPVLALGLIQTHRFFRAQVAANKMRVVLCALPLVMVAFLGGLGDAVFSGLLFASWNQERTIITETDRAFGILAARDRDGDKVRPRRLSADDLAQASPLSDITQHWLRGASITLASAPEHVGTGPGRYFPGRRSYFVPPKVMKDKVPYSAVIRAANGTQCSVSYEVQKEGPFGYLTAVCQ